MEYVSPECPEDAIKPDTDPDGEGWVEFNRKWSEAWTVLDTQKEPKCLRL